LKPCANGMHRNVTDLSFLFWKDVPFPPNATAYTGMEVVSYLTKANLVAAREKYAAVYGSPLVLIFFLTHATSNQV
jgi:hypothetical protein